MKIAMFTNTFAPLVGGIEKSVATFREDLRVLGHEVLVVTLQQGGEEPGEPGLLRLPALPGVVGGQYAWKLPGAAGLSEALDEFSPDLIHAHQPFMLGSSAYRHSVRRGLPLVFTNHTLYERYADRSFLGGLEALERAARALVVVYSSRCDAVIAPTGSIAEILEAQGVASKIDIVPTGIDIAKFARGDGAGFRKRHGIPGDAFLVGHLGRLIPAKRVAYLAEATAGFLSGSTQAFALFCGEGEAVGEIRDRFTAAGVADRLVLVGNLPDDEVPDAYAAMDLFTFASLTDTQGIVLLEAMAAGVPVLALRATGPQDLVIDGWCGRLLAPEANPADFSRAIAEFSLSPELAAFAGAAREHAASFDRRRCVGQLLAVYESAVRRHGEREYREGHDDDSALDTFQRRVEAEWQLLAGRAEILRALLPTRGFPGFPE